jgi:hypothetical protein
MSRFSQFGLGIGFFLAFILCVAASRPQEPEMSGDLNSRVEKLEARVAELERILFMTSKMTAFEAERRLEEARLRLRDSRALLVQGLITQFQFQQDEFNVQRMQRELELAQSPDNQRQVVGSLELFAAERRLAEARANLAFTEQLAGRGYATTKHLGRERQQVEFAEKELNLAREKANAATKLQGLDSPTAKSPETPSDQQKDK